MTNDYRIKKDVEPYLHDSLHVVLLQYIKDEYSQRYIDMYRGILNAFFNIDSVGVKSYLFLFNFLDWLEHRSNYSDIDDDMYEGFFNRIVKEL